MIITGSFKHDSDTGKLTMIVEKPFSACMQPFPIVRVKNKDAGDVEGEGTINLEGCMLWFDKNCVVSHISCDVSEIKEPDV